MMGVIVWAVISVHIIFLHKYTDASCFFGTTDSCAFTCHCVPLEVDTCRNTRGTGSGRCIEDSCDPTPRPALNEWTGLACQISNLSMNKVAIATGASTGVQYVLDGDIFHAVRTTGTSCEIVGGAYLEIDLGSEGVISSVKIFVLYLEEQQLQGLEVHIYIDSSDAVYPLNMPNCGIQIEPPTRYISFITITCAQPILGRYVKLQKNTADAWGLSEAVVFGYPFYDCTHVVDGGYFYGPACLLECHCESQCNVVSGTCPTSCLPGYVGEQCQNECADGSWGLGCTESCHCGGLEVCSKPNGHCYACAAGYTGDGSLCTIALPDLSDSVASLSIEDHTVTVEFDPTTAVTLAAIVLQYRLNRGELVSTWLHTVPSSNRQRRSVNGMDQVRFYISDQDFFINSLYEMRIIPWVVTDYYIGFSIPSPTQEVQTGCTNNEQYDSEACQEWCQCGSFGNDLCILTGQTCFVGCGLDPITDEHCTVYLPSTRNIAITFEEINTDSLQIVINTDYTALPFVSYTVAYKIEDHETVYPVPEISIETETGIVRREINTLQTGKVYTFRITPYVLYNDNTFRSAVLQSSRIRIVNDNPQINANGTVNGTDPRTGSSTIRSYLLHFILTIVFGICLIFCGIVIAILSQQIYILPNIVHPIHGVNDPAVNSITDVEC